MPGTSSRTPPTYEAVVSELRAVAKGKGASPGPAAAFLREIGLVNGTLTEPGRGVFQALFVEQQAPTLVWPERALRWRPFKIVHDVFAGRTSVQTNQIRHLWILHDEPGLTSERNLGMALTFGHNLGVFRYRSRAHEADVPAVASVARELGHVIHPDTPFANLQALERIVRNCKGNILWLDKHFGKRGLDILADTVDGTRHQTVKLLVGSNENSGDRFVRASARLGLDLAQRCVKLEVRRLAESDASMTHDRWLGDGATWFNLPPLNSVLQGQHGEILPSKASPFSTMWSNGTPVEFHSPADMAP